MSKVYEFGPFQMHTSDRVLLRQGVRVPLTPKAYAVLLMLVEHTGNLVEKRQLIEAVWSGAFVEEGNICVTVSMLRKALGSADTHATYIETVPTRGYRFVVPVSATASPEPVPQELEKADDRVATVPAVAEVASVPVAVEVGSHPVVTPPNPPMPALLAPSDAAHQDVALWKRQPLWMLASAVFIVVMGFMVHFWIAGSVAQTSASDLAPIKSLAILPFTMVGDQSTDPYLGVGMSTAVTTRLANLRRVLVRPTSAMERYMTSHQDPRAVGREQGVEAVLDGRIQHIGDRIRLTVQLVRVSDGAEIWGQTFNEKYTDIFAVQDLVSEEVAQSIQLQLTREEKLRLKQHPTESQSAYASYARGRFFMDKRTVGGLQKGLTYYRDAVAADAGYAEAYDGIANSYALLGIYAGLAPRDAFPKAKEAAIKVLGMDQTLSDAHTTLGLVHLYYDWDGVAAEREFRSAIAINPKDALAHSWNAENLAALGRYAEAVSEARSAKEADPLSPAVSTNAGFVSYLAGDIDQAIVGYKGAIEIDPDFPRAHYRLGVAYLSKKENGQALEELLKAVQLSNGDPYYQAGVGMAYAASGKPEATRKILHDFLNPNSNVYVPPYAIAQMYVSLGENDKAFEWLDQAYRDRSTSMAYLKVDPSLNPLRSDKRFEALLQRARPTV